PVPEQETDAHARVFDDAEPDSLSRWRGCPCRLRGQAHPRRSGWYNYRRSMAGLRTPLPTLRLGPRGPTRTARGRCGSLLLHRGGLAPPVSYRSPGARLTNSIGYAAKGWVEQLRFVFGVVAYFPGVRTRHLDRFREHSAVRLALPRHSLLLD